MAQATAGPPKKHGKRKVHHIHIEKAKNGFTVSHRRDQPKHISGAAMPAYEEDQKPSVFTDQKAAMQHVGGLMGEMGGDEEQEA